ncbi:MAG TPA: hypothetical protein PKH07_14670, partial [bacterium]|nr:hypothetical protein [bacterium]
MQKRLMTRQQLKEVLVRNQCAFDEIFGHEGQSALLLQRGARIIGLFPDSDPDAINVLWVNPLLERLLTGKIQDWVEEGMG